MSGGTHEELTEVLDSEYIHINNPNPLTLTSAPLNPTLCDE